MGYYLRMAWPEIAARSEGRLIACAAPGEKDAGSLLHSWPIRRKKESQFRIANHMESDY
jgi:hypothetical protein